MSQIPESYQDLLDQPVLYNLATVNPNGTVQVNPVWGEVVDGNVRINTAAGRRKHKNLIERPEQVTVLVNDPANPQRYVEIRGRVAEATEEDADGVIDGLAKKYLGVDSYPFRNATETRVTFVIEPTKVFVQG